MPKIFFALFRFLKKIDFFGQPSAGAELRQKNIRNFGNELLLNFSMEIE